MVRGILASPIKVRLSAEDLRAAQGFETSFPQLGSMRRRKREATAHAQSNRGHVSAPRLRQVDARKLPSDWSPGFAQHALQEEGSCESLGRTRGVDGIS